MRNLMRTLCVLIVIFISGSQGVGQDAQVRISLDEAIGVRWNAEADYQKSAGHFWDAYRRAEEAYRKVKEAGANMQLLREASSLSDAVARQIAGQIEGNFTCKAVSVLAGPAGSIVCNSQTAFDLAKWIAVDLEMVPNAIKNRVIIARELKPALDEMKKSQETLKKVKKVLQRRNGGGLQLSRPADGQRVWDAKASGTARPGQRLKVFIFTDRVYLQGESVADKSGRWEVSSYPTKGTMNVIFAAAYDEKGRAVAYSDEKEIPASWVRPKAK